MHEIDGSGHIDNQFTEGDPTSGIPTTVITGDWLNAVQNELVNAIENAGLTLDKEDNTQLLQAMIAKIASNGRVQKSIYIKGLLTTSPDLIKFLAGIDGNIKEIGAAIDDGTSATLVFTNNGDTVATLVATQAGALASGLSNTEVTKLSKIGMGITAVAGTPATLEVFIALGS